MFGTLTYQELTTELAKIGNGRIARIGYRTSLPLKAEFKNDGMKIIKFTDTSVRIGVKYDSIESVKKRKSLNEGVSRKTVNSYIWLIDNRIRYNKNTDKAYLYVATLNKGHHTNSRYIVNYPKKGIFTTLDSLESSEFKDCIINSYFTKKSNPREVYNIAIENIYKINKLEV